MNSRLQAWLLALTLAAASAGVSAQTTAPAASAAVAASTPAAAPDAKAAAPQSANIFAVGKDSQAERVKSQPGNNAPMWREVATGTEQVTTLPFREGGVLMQKSGEAWRQFRNADVTRKGGWALVGVLALIALFYLYRGPIRVSEPPTGRLIERFTLVERSVHWANAGCFVILALSGLLMLFGKHVVLPVLGHTVFSWIALLSKNLHNFVGPLFLVTLLLIILTFIRDNIPKLSDLGWLVRAGGLFSKKGGHIPSGRFNGGEKVLFWGGVVVLGFIVASTGLIMDFPNYGQTRAEMQNYWSWHAVAALVFIAMIMGHIYIGTVGTEGALDAMKTGYVDESWAKEHHEDWYRDVKSGKIPAQRSAPAAGLEPPARPAA